MRAVRARWIVWLVPVRAVERRHIMQRLTQRTIRWYQVIEQAFK